MCVVSMVGDAYNERWKWVPQVPANPNYRAEFDALKADVEEMKTLLRAAKRIDELTGQPDCENAEKLAVLRRVAELVGVDLADVIGSAS